MFVYMKKRLQVEKYLLLWLENVNSRTHDSRKTFTVTGFIVNTSTFIFTQTGHGKHSSSTQNFDVDENKNMKLSNPNTFAGPISS